MLETFAYVRPGTRQRGGEAARRAGRARARRRHRPRRLPARRVFEAATVVSLTKTRRTARHHRGRRRRLRIGALTTIAEIAAHPVDQGEVPGAGAGGLAGGEPAAAQPGHHRRQPLPAAALLVLPRRLRVHAEGRRHVLRHRRREPVPRHLRRRRLLASCIRRTRRRRWSRSDAKVRLVGPKGPRTVPAREVLRAARRGRARGRPCSSRARW